MVTKVSAKLQVFVCYWVQPTPTTICSLPNPSHLSGPGHTTPSDTQCLSLYSPSSPTPSPLRKTISCTPCRTTTHLLVGWSSVTTHVGLCWTVSKTPSRKIAPPMSGVQPVSHSALSPISRWHRTQSLESTCLLQWNFHRSNTGLSGSCFP